MAWKGRNSIIGRPREGVNQESDTKGSEYWPQICQGWLDTRKTQFPPCPPWARPLGRPREARAAHMTNADRARG
jgi:hypothetical protein